MTSAARFMRRHTVIRHFVLICTGCASDACAWSRPSWWRGHSGRAGRRDHCGQPDAMTLTVQSLATTLQTGSHVAAGALSLVAVAILPYRPRQAR